MVDTGNPSGPLSAEDEHARGSPGCMERISSLQFWGFVTAWLVPPVGLVIDGALLAKRKVVSGVIVILLSLLFLFLHLSSGTVVLV